MSRTKNATINLIASIGSYAISTIIAFVYRTFFIKELGSVYLGVQGLFTSMLTLLSLVELGVGNALTFSMYKPLAKKNEEKVRQLLKYYEKAYRIIAVIVLGFGISLLPFIDFFIKGRPDIPESLEFIYLLYVFNSALSYLCIYKQSILQADQKGFVVSLSNSVFQIFRTILQIVSLFILKSFIITLVIQIACTVIGNLFISKYAEKKYPYIRNLKNVKEIEKTEKKTITDKIRALFLYKIGSYIVNGTDSILISEFVGIVENGMYSNYLMPISVIKSLFEFGCNALTPGLGNKSASVSSDLGESKEEDFLTLLYIHFLFCSVITSSFIAFIERFIFVWAGPDYLLGDLTVIFLGINMYMYCMRRVSISYRNAFGLYTYARYKPIVEAIINLFASLLLMIKFGLAGVVMGTTVGELLTSFWIEPYVLYKHHFKKTQKEYWEKYIVYSLITLVFTIVGVLLNNSYEINSWLKLVIVGGLFAAIQFIIINVLFFKTKEGKAARIRVRNLFNKVKTPRK